MVRLYAFAICYVTNESSKHDKQNQVAMMNRLPRAKKNKGVGDECAAADVIMQQENVTPEACGIACRDFIRLIDLI